jgi:hypothetical protein
VSRSPGCAKLTRMTDEHDEHEHDEHEHDHVDEEAEEAQAEADVERMAAAIAALDDDALTEGLDGMTEKSRIELAGQLNLPRATMHLGNDALVPLVRRKLRSATPDRKLQAAFAIAERANDTTIAALGDRSADPTKDDLLEVLPGVLEKHNAALVTMLLAGYAASDAPVRPVTRELLDEDERFVIGEPVAVEAPPSAGEFGPANKLSDKELKAKRKQRRAAKDAKRAAAARDKEARTGAEAKRRAAVHDAKRKAK